MTMVKLAWLAPVLMLAALPVLASNKPPAKKPAPKRPDPALLEFLGTWESPDGNWVDPMTFARIDPAKAEQNHVRREGKSPAATGKPPKDNGDGGNGV